MRIRTSLCVFGPPGPVSAGIRRLHSNAFKDIFSNHLFLIAGKYKGEFTCTSWSTFTEETLMWFCSCRFRRRWTSWREEKVSTYFPSRLSHLEESDQTFSLKSLPECYNDCERKPSKTQNHEPSSGRDFITLTSLSCSLTDEGRRWWWWWWWMWCNIYLYIRYLILIVPHEYFPVQERKLNYKLHELNLIKIFVAINKTYKFKEWF